tara:strand:+ start:1042 stop:1980 length:939 start_codon:yes stop_codon:yes gene_type:complete
MISPQISAATSPFLSPRNSGLGNALFQIFTAYSFSKTYDHELNLDLLFTLLDTLKQYNQLHSDTIYRNIITLHTKKPNDGVERGVIEISEQRDFYSLCDNTLVEKIKSVDPHTNNCVLHGYLQSYLYFNQYYNEILALTTPDSKSENYMHTKYNHLFDPQTINISVHMRLNWCGTLTYERSYKYFHDAIAYIIENHVIDQTKNIVINVFADNIDEVSTSFRSEKYETIFYENNPDYIDMWCMSLCNHNVLSHSTLSWWGAYLNQNHDKCVIYSNDLLRLCHATLYETPQWLNRKTEHYLPNWVGIDTKALID